MEHEHYKAKQDCIYEEFRAATASLTAIKTDAALSNPCAGYLIALRHPAAIMEPFSHYASLLRQIVPALRYDAANGHTTLTVYEKQPLATFQPDASILNVLHRVAAQIDEQLWRQVRIDLRDWYFNHETIIVAGEPNKAFWEVGAQVQAAGRQHGLALCMPWGAHLTAGRFTQSCDANRVASLRQHVQHTPGLGVSAPTAIFVGYYTTSKAGFVLHAS